MTAAAIALLAVIGADPARCPPCCDPPECYQPPPPARAARLAKPEPTPKPLWLQPFEHIVCFHEGEVIVDAIRDPITPTAWHTGDRCPPVENQTCGYYQFWADDGVGYDIYREHDPLKDSCTTTYQYVVKIQTPWRVALSCYHNCEPCRHGWQVELIPGVLKCSPPPNAPNIIQPPQETPAAAGKGKGSDAP